MAFQEDGTRVTAAEMFAKLEFVFIHEVRTCHEYFFCRTWHCLHMQAVVAAQQMNARAWVKALLICSSAQWDHDWSVFLFPVAGVWSNREFYVAVAELLVCVPRYSETKGWQLLWLCTGLFPPSKSLLKHAQKFIETRQKETLALGCRRRIQTVMR